MLMVTACTSAGIFTSLVDGEFDFDVAAFRGDLGDLAHRHADHRDHVLDVQTRCAVELGGHGYRIGVRD